MIITHVLDFKNLSAKDTLNYNKLVESLIVDYTSYIDDFCRMHCNDKYLWTLPLVSRNINNTSSFQKLSRVLYALHYIKSNETTHVMFESYEEKAVFEEYCHKKRIQVIVSSYNKKYPIIKIVAKSGILFFKRMTHYVKIRTNLKKKQLDKDKELNIINIPVLSSQIDDSEYHDRYFNEIQEYIDEKLLFFPCIGINDSKSVAETVDMLQKTSNYEFILKEQFLRISDYFRYISYFIYCLKCCKEKFLFRNIDVSKIIRQELLFNSSEIVGFIAVLDERLMFRLKKAGVQIKNFVTWHESRAMDINIIRSYRKYYPNGNSVAFLAYSFDDTSMGLAPTLEQYRQKVVANKYAVPNESYANMIKKFDNRIETVNVPILRNKYELRGHFNAVDCKRVLLVLSFFKNQAKKQIEFMNNYVKECDVNITVYVKNHPDFYDKELQYYYQGEVFFNYKYVSGTLEGCLKDTDIAIISNSTSSLEVLYASVPLIIIVPNGAIKHTALPEGFFEHMYKIAYGDEDFKLYMDYFCKKNGYMYNRELEGFLLEKNKDNIKKMFNDI